jgi:hypothetical protein
MKKEDNEEPCMTEYEDDRYRMFPCGHSWQGAERICSSIGMELPQPRNEEENNHLKKYIREKITDGSAKHVWLGLKTVDDVLVNVNGENVIYTNWNTGEGNKQKSNAYINNAGDWFKDDADKANTYTVCTLETSGNDLASDLTSPRKDFYNTRS